ncbi:anthranilate synthase component I [Hansschlegelia zhihuaiae]|uniref:Anthranilate synthase component 1 n=1 Tax=Hansschlegelia zhihuaiae TaxID=405005 RepID=A0A4Q0MKC5_9HYPH|nr:anthranilate synthase component I [Hansschlegelia zhihuaiae]RXF73945.1 anthranilate synthase component I [Hansschlegelia zhihuaiae]
MLIAPALEDFAPAYENGRPQLVWTTLVGDLETPVSAYLKLAEGQANAFLFESVEGGAVRGRYSIIGLKPDLLWRSQGGRAEINRSAARDRDAFESADGRPLETLRALLSESRIEVPEALPPMAAGVFGYLGYDMVREMEELGPPNPDALGVPDAIMMRPTVIVVFDSVKDEITVVTPARPEPGVTAAQAHARAVDRLTEIVEGLDRAVPKEAASEVRGLDGYDMTSNTAPAEYEAMVLRAKEYVAAGDIFQVVLSQRFEAPFDLPAFALYRALRRTNPAPFLIHLDFGSFQIVGSSPEILVRSRDGKVTIRPIAGTRPRGATPAEDKALAAELLADPKERAEHLMLLDLGRNDVGRVSEIGSGAVTDQFFLERYSHVMHIVSNVEGALAPEHDALDALAAGFPAGTVSGAPKVRAMEIIDELERDKRGVYAGCVGYFGANGEMDTCIVLRTAVVKDGRIFVQAGAGIVADSSPASEQAECVNKAKALFRAAEEARRFASGGRRGQ